MSKSKCGAAIKYKDVSTARDDLANDVDVYLINEFKKTYAYKCCSKFQCQDSNFCTVHDKIFKDNRNNLTVFKDDILPHAKVATPEDTFFQTTSKATGEKKEKVEKRRRKLKVQVKVQVK